MPHLEVHTFIGQIFWLAVCFILLYLAMWRLVVPKISNVIEGRGTAIAADLSLAENMNNEVKSLEQQYESVLAETGEKARKLIEESAQKAKTAAEKKRAELGSKLDEKLKLAEQEIARVEKESLASVDKMSGELARMIVSKFKAA